MPQSNDSFLAVVLKHVSIIGYKGGLSITGHKYCKFTHQDKHVSYCTNKKYIALQYNLCVVDTGDKRKNVGNGESIGNIK